MTDETKAILIVLAAVAGVGLFGLGCALLAIAVSL